MKSKFITADKEIRPASRSAQLSFASALYLDNEISNACSHLIGGLLFMLLPLYFYAYLLMEL